MSGSLFSQATQWITGAPAPLSLGSLTLAGAEVPSRISVGGSLLTAIHRLPGGGRVYDVIGPDEGAIAWSGFFLGIGAVERARVVEALRKTGIISDLSFGDVNFQVIVVQFEYDYQQRGNVIRYRVRCEVVPASATTSSTSSGISLAGVDLGAAAAVIQIAVGIGAPLAALLTTGQKAGQAAGMTILNGAATSLAAATASIAAAQVGGLSGSSSSAILATRQTIDGGLAAAGESVGNQSLLAVSRTGAGLAYVTSQAATIAALAQARAYSSRAFRNAAAT